MKPGIHPMEERALVVPRVEITKEVLDGLGGLLRVERDIEAAEIGFDDDEGFRHRRSIDAGTGRTPDASPHACAATSQKKERPPMSSTPAR
jgi:hypothetical protein